MISYIDRLSTKPSSELRYICHSNVIECPKQIFIKCSWTFNEAYFDAIC